jgi:hypothetical protein
MGSRFAAGRTSTDWITRFAARSIRAALVQLSP